MLSFQVIMDRGPKQGADHETKVTNHVSDGFFFVAKLEKVCAVSLFSLIHTFHLG